MNKFDELHTFLRELLLPADLGSLIFSYLWCPDIVEAMAGGEDIEDEIVRVQLERYAEPFLRTRYRYVLHLDTVVEKNGRHEVQYTLCNSEDDKDQLVTLLFQQGRVRTYHPRDVTKPNENYRLSRILALHVRYKTEVKQDLRGQYLELNKFIRDCQKETEAKEMLRIQSTCNT